VKSYLARIEELTETPIDIVSVGPDRDQTIVLRNPYAPKRPGVKPPRSKKR
jgi:adenylosuccinate synthase